MKNIKIIFIAVLSILILTNCSTDKDRRIKLASKPTNGLMRDRVETITIAASQKKSVAIFHFINSTENQDLDWLEKGIVEMLTTNLSLSRQLFVIPTSQIEEVITKSGYDLDAIDDSTVVTHVAQQLNSEVFICGNYAFNGDSLMVNVELRNGLNGALLNRTSIKGGGIENVFTMVNQATRVLRADLQLTFRDKGEIDDRLAEFATSSLDAYKYFTQGEDEVEKLKMAAAKPYFLKAIAADSTFSSAYLMMAYIYVNVSKMDSAQMFINKALKYIENSPPKEQLHIQSWAAIVEGNIEKAAEIYQQLTEKYPGDDQGHYLLGNYYYGAGNNIEKAVEHFEAAVTLNPNNKLALNMLGYSYERMERLDYAINVFEKYTKLASDEPNPFDSYGEVLLRKGRMDAAIDKFKKALEIDPNFHVAVRHLVWAYLDKAEFKNAQKVMNQYESKISDVNDKYRFYTTESFMYIKREEFEAARKAALLAYDLNPYMPSAIILLYNIDKDRDAAIRRLHKWIEYEASHEGDDKITFDVLFTLASLTLYLDADAAPVDKLMSKFLDEHKSLTLFLSATAFKQIFMYQDGRYDESLENAFFQNFQPEHFSKMPSVPWNVYWKYYFPSIQNVLKAGNLPKKYLRDFRDFAAQNKNLHFEIQSCFAVALQYLMEGNISSAKKQLLAVGTSMESNWQIIGPFKVTKGFHQEFWPEKDRITDVLEKDDESEWVDVTDNMTDGYIDLKKIVGDKFNTATFAILPINVPSSRNVQLRFGANGALKVWLNDEPVLVKNMYDLATLDSYIVNARLQEGTNYLLIKVNSIFGENGFYFRLTDEEGYGFYDVSFGESLAT